MKIYAILVDFIILTHYDNKNSNTTLQNRGAVFMISADRIRNPYAVVKGKAAEEFVPPGH
ncbi:hypothetical protein SDC9_66469 [bioreactor metagenome]|uniref:Uncharacterized protein n=1 Tax=bioreactor metagenome TaxID=1076179 RepID=A0A644XUZ3_9ZZZZ